MESKSPAKGLSSNLESGESLKDRFPTKLNLFRRQVIVEQQELLSGFCEVESESVDHLFIHCHNAYKVWMKVYEWLGCEVALPSNIGDFYLFHKGLLSGKNVVRRG